jgi:peptidoglycan hydrolase-like protein with peptidoglycan-binding domain
MHTGTTNRLVAAILAAALVLAPLSYSAVAEAQTKPGVSAKKRASKSSKRRGRRQHGQKAPQPDRIREIQEALAKDGAYTGAPTGKWDSTTVEAMKRFQAAHGLNPTGKLDARSLQKLGLGSQITGVASPMPSVTASTAAPEPARRRP